MKMITIGVQMTANFGLLNEETDEVIETTPITLNLASLSPEFFNAALKQFQDTKQKLAAEKIPAPVAEVK